MDFGLLVLQAAVMAVAHGAKPRVHWPDEELVSYWLGEDLSKDSIFSSDMDMDLEFAPQLFPPAPASLPAASMPAISNPLAGINVLGLLASVAVALLVAFAGNVYLTLRWMKTWDVLGIPAPPCSTILGNSLQIRKMGGLRNSLRNWYQVYGKVFGIHIGRQPVLVVAEAAIAEEILENQSENFTDRYEAPRILRKELGDMCLFMSHGQMWESFHYILTTAFCPENLTFMVHRINFCANNLAEGIEDIASFDKEKQMSYNLKDLMTSFSYDTMAAMILGLELEHYNNPDHEFFHVVKATVDGITEDFSGVPVTQKMRRLKKFFLEKMRERSEKKRREGLVDFLEIFMFSGSSTATDEKGLKYPMYTMNPEDIAATLTHWVLHGHETLVSCLQFVLYILASYPDHQQIVQAEIDNNVVNDEPSYEDLCNLPFMDLIIKEVLRMYSPVQEIWRYASTTSEVKGFTIPANTAIIIAVDLIHEDADYFLEPEDFEPERYFTEHENAVATSDVFLSFGSGPKTCVGYEVALLQIKSALVHIIRKVKLTNPVHSDSVEFDPETQGHDEMVVTQVGILKPRDPLHLRLEARRPQDVFTVTPSTATVTKQQEPDPNAKPSPDDPKPNADPDPNANPDPNATPNSNGKKETALKKEEDILPDKFDQRVRFDPNVPEETSSKRSPRPSQTPEGAGKGDNSPSASASSSQGNTTSPSASVSQEPSPARGHIAGTSDSSPDSPSSVMTRGGPDVVSSSSGVSPTQAGPPSPPPSPPPAMEPAPALLPTVSDMGVSLEQLLRMEQEQREAAAAAHLDQASPGGKRSDVFYDAVEKSDEKLSPSRPPDELAMDTVTQVSVSLTLMDQPRTGSTVEMKIKTDSARETDSNSDNGHKHKTKKKHKHKAKAGKSSDAAKLGAETDSVGESGQKHKKKKKQKDKGATEDTPPAPPNADTAADEAADDAAGKKHKKKKSQQQEEEVVQAQENANKEEKPKEENTATVEPGAAADTEMAADELVLAAVPDDDDDFLGFETADELVEAGIRRKVSEKNHKDGGGGGTEPVPDQSGEQGHKRGEGGNDPDESGASDTDDGKKKKKKKKKKKAETAATTEEEEAGGEDKKKKKKKKKAQTATEGDASVDDVGGDEKKKKKKKKKKADDSGELENPAGSTDKTEAGGEKKKKKKKKKGA